MVDAPRTPVPAAVAYVRDVLDGFERPWLLSGGWAVTGDQNRPQAKTVKLGNGLTRAGVRAKNC